MKKTLGNLADNLKWQEETIVQIRTPDGLTIPVKISIKETGEEAGEKVAEKVAKDAIEGNSQANISNDDPQVQEFIKKFEEKYPGRGISLDIM